VGVGCVWWGWGVGGRRGVVGGGWVVGRWVVGGLSEGHTDTHAISSVTYSVPLLSTCVSTCSSTLLWDYHTTSCVLQHQPTPPPILHSGYCLRRQPTPYQVAPYLAIDLQTSQLKECKCRWTLDEHADT
jgi:hypothetical protein